MHSMGIYPGPVIVPEAEKKALVRNRALLPLFLSRNRKWLQDYFTRYKSFPILKNARFNFWDFRTSQFLWMDDFHTLIDGPAGPEGKISKVEPSWKITDPETKGLKTPGEKEFLFYLVIPFLGNLIGLPRTPAELFTPQTCRIQFSLHHLLSEWSTSGAP